MLHQQSWLSLLTDTANNFFSSIITNCNNNIPTNNILSFNNPITLLDTSPQKDPWSETIERDDDPYVKTFSWVMFSIFTVYTIISIIVFLFRKDKQPIKSRSPVFVFILMLDHYFSFAVLSLRLAVGRVNFPCVIYLAFQFYGFPLIAIPYLVQCIRLYYISEVNRLQGDSFQSHINSLGIDLFVDKNNNNDGSVTSNNNEPSEKSKRLSFKRKASKLNVFGRSNSTLVTNNTVEGNKVVSGSKSIATAATQISKEKDWSEKRRKLLKAIRKLGQDDFILKIFFLTFLLNSLIFLAYAGYHLNRITGENTWDKGCAATVSVYIGSFCLIGFYALFLLLFFYKVMRYAKESFGIKRELIIVVVIWVIFLIPFVLMSAINEYPEYTFSAAWCVCFGIFITSIVSVWVPIVRSFYWGKTIHFGRKKTKLNEQQAEAIDESHVINVGSILQQTNDDFKKTLFIEAKLITIENNTDEGKEEQANKILDPRIIIFVLFHEEVCQRYLKEFCEKEFSIENFLFIFFMHKVYKELKVNTLENASKKLLVAQNLFDNFVRANSAFELNLPSHVRTTIVRTLKTLNEAMRPKNSTKESISSTNIELEDRKLSTSSSDISNTEQVITTNSNVSNDWTEQHGIELNRLFDSVEDGVLESVQDTWSRFIENDSFITMCKELQQYETEMKKLNLR
ncbi:hypothetical protein ABK040_008238 [Willaertia magna]